jgi:hypothetical protein
MLTDDDVRKMAMELPEAQELETWGHPTFRVRNAIFASTSADSLVCIVKASREDQAMLIAANPDVYSVADYFGRFGWVRIQLAGADPDETRELIVEGWRRAAPRKLVEEFDRLS